MKKALLILAAVILLSPRLPAQEAPLHQPDIPREGPGMVNPLPERPDHPLAAERERLTHLLRQQQERLDRLEQQQGRLMEALQARPQNAPQPKAPFMAARPHKCPKPFCCLLLLGCAVVHVLTAVWVFQDIRVRGAGSGLWIVIALLAGLLGVLVYAVVRIGDFRKT
jgi:hypothetical protein